MDVHMAHACCSLSNIEPITPTVKNVANSTLDFLFIFSLLTISHELYLLLNHLLYPLLFPKVYFHIL